MKRVYSLTGRYLISEVFEKGKKYQLRGIRIFILECGTDFFKSNKSAGERRKVRIGIAVGKKYGKAHERNRIKRRIRSIMGEMIYLLKENSCVMINPGYETKLKSFEDIKNDIITLLKKGGILEK